MSSSHPPITIHRISDLSDPRIEPTVQILGEAFRNDQISEAMIGRHEEYRFDMYRGIMPAYILGGHCYIAVDEAGNVIGTVTWYPPGADFLQDEPSKKALEPFFEEMKKKYPELHDFWLNKLLPAYWDVTKFFPSPNPTKPGTFKFQNWNFLGFAVSPSFQRRGIGKALLKAGIDEATKTKGIICVETESEHQMQMYQHVGFRLIGTEYVEGQPGQPGYHQRALIID